MNQQLYISLVSENGKQVFPIIGEESFIGRAENCNIQLNDQYISAIHAKITRKNDRVVIEDLGSVNGIYLDGEKINEAEVNDKNTIQIGASKFRLEAKQVNLDENQFDSDKSTVFKIPGKDRLTNVAEDLVSVKKNFKKSDADQTAFINLNQASFESSEMEDVYLFEERGQIRPILQKVENSKSLEVIKMYKDSVISIEYFPLQSRRVFITGRHDKKDAILIDTLEKAEQKGILEYQKNKKVKFIPLLGHDNFVVKKGAITQINKKTVLNYSDLIKIKKGKYSINLKMVDSPPKLKELPFGGYDNKFKLLVGSALLISLTLFSVAQFFEVKKVKPKQEKKVKVTKVIYKPKEPEPVIEKEIKEPEPIPEKVIKVKEKIEQSAKSVEMEKPIEKVVEKVVKKVEVTKKPVKQVKKKRVVKTESKKVVKSAQKEIKKVATFKKFNFSKDLKSISTNKTRNLNFGAKSAEVIGKSNQKAMGINVGRIEAAKSDGVVGKLDVGSLGKVVSSKGIGTFGMNKNTKFTKSYGKTVLLGSIDPEIIRELLRRNLPQFRYCYDEELRRKRKKVKGKMNLDFVIGPNGRVVKSNIELRAFNLSGEGTKCMKRVLGGIAFPRPKGGGIVEVTQPIFLEPDF